MSRLLCEQRPIFVLLAEEHLANDLEAIGRSRIADQIILMAQRIAQTMASQRSSTAQDLAAGKRSEIDHLNGYVARRGEALGVPVPVNRALWVTVKLLERGARGAA